MNDIVERLRDDQPNDRQRQREARMDLGGLLMEAADEIEKLRAERDELKNKLSEANHYLESSAAECYSLNAVNERLTAERDALRAALQGLVNDLDDYPAVARLLDTYEYARAALGEKK